MHRYADYITTDTSEQSKGEWHVKGDPYLNSNDNEKKHW